MLPFPSILKIRKLRLVEVNHRPKDTQLVSHRADTRAQVFWSQGQYPSLGQPHPRRGLSHSDGTIPQRGERGERQTVYSYSALQICPKY